MTIRAGSRIYRRTSVKFTGTLKSIRVPNVEKPSAKSVMWGCMWSGFTTKEGTCVRSVARLCPRSGTTWRSVTTSRSSTLRMYRFSGQWSSVVSLRIISTAWIFVSYFVKCYDVFIITYMYQWISLYFSQGKIPYTQSLGDYNIPTNFLHWHLGTFSSFRDNPWKLLPKS